MNLPAMERHLAERDVLSAIPDMSHEERMNKLAEYQTEVSRLADEEEQALDQLRLAGPDNVDMQALRTVRSLARQHRSAQLSLERLERAITKEERAVQDRQPQANIDCTHQPISKKRGIS